MPDGSFKKLRKFLYGLKQSGAEWFDRYSKFLISLGYDRSETEPCLWMWREFSLDIQRHGSVSLRSYPRLIRNFEYRSNHSAPDCFKP